MQTLLQNRVEKHNDAGNYDEAAAEFIKATDSTITSEYVPGNSCRPDETDEKHILRPRRYGLKFSVTIKRGTRTYTFDYWRKPTAPDAYSVLACLETSGADTFEDFCAEYGYDTDSRSAERTYRAVRDQVKELRQLYTDDEMEALAAIN